jgi:hypothetical protein
LYQIKCPFHIDASFYIQENYCSSGLKHWSHLSFETRNPIKDKRTVGGVTNLPEIEPNNRTKKFSKVGIEIF